MPHFKPKKAKSSMVSRYRGAPERVFPLLCSVREKEWIEPWNSEVLHSDSGIAEKNCVFTTGYFGEQSEAALSGGADRDVWVISRYEPNQRIEFVRMNRDRVLCLSYILSDNGDGTTRAEIEQFLVGLTEEGNRMVDSIAQTFPVEFRLGEKLLNHYLTTGKLLPFREALGDE